jgi:hypothetical protein
VITEIEKGTNLLHYIDGPAGSWKTYLYEALYHYFESQVNVLYQNIYLYVLIFMFLF